MKKKKRKLLKASFFIGALDALCKYDRNNIVINSFGLGYEQGFKAVEEAILRGGKK